MNNDDGKFQETGNFFHGPLLVLSSTTGNDDDLFNHNLNNLNVFIYNF